MSAACCAPDACSRHLLCRLVFAHAAPQFVFYPGAHVHAAAGKPAVLAATPAAQAKQAERDTEFFMGW